MNKQRLGTDPLSWISSTKDTQEVTETAPGKKEIPSRIERPVTIKREIIKSSQSGLPEGWTRATFIVEEKTLERLKDLAYTERKQLKIVLQDALESHLKGKKTIKREG